MRKVDLVDSGTRPCNFSDFYYYPKYFNDEKIEAIHEMVRRGGYKFEKGGTGRSERYRSIWYKQQRCCVMSDPNSW